MLKVYKNYFLIIRLLSRPVLDFLITIYYNIFDKVLLYIQNDFNILNYKVLYDNYQTMKRFSIINMLIILLLRLTSIKIIIYRDY